MQQNPQCSDIVLRWKSTGNSTCLEHVPTLHKATFALTRVSTCKSHQTQSEGHIHLLEKSHGGKSCSSLGTGMFQGLFLGKKSVAELPKKGSQSGKSHRGCQYTPSESLHNRQIPKRSNQQMCRVGKRSVRARSRSSLPKVCPALCWWVPSQKTDPTSWSSCVPLYLGKMLGNIFWTEPIFQLRASIPVTSSRHTS